MPKSGDSVEDYKPLERTFRRFWRGDIVKPVSPTPVQTVSPTLVKKISSTEHIQQGTPVLKVPNEPGKYIDDNNRCTGDKNVSVPFCKVYNHKTWMPYYFPDQKCDNEANKCVLNVGATEAFNQVLSRSQH